MGTPAGATTTPRPPRASSSTATATATATAAASWKIEGQEVRRSVAGAKEDAKRMPRTDSFQRYGTLTIQCFDRLSRKPLPGCAVCVSRVVRTATKMKGGGGHPAAAAAAATPRRMKNAASTFGQATVSDEDGFIRCKVLLGKYTLSATCTGYYPHGGASNDNSNNSGGSGGGGGRELIVDVSSSVGGGAAAFAHAKVLMVPVKAGSRPL